MKLLTPKGSVKGNFEKSFELNCLNHFIEKNGKGLYNKIYSIVETCIERMDPSVSQNIKIKNYLQSSILIDIIETYELNPDYQYQEESYYEQYLVGLIHSYCLEQQIRGISSTVNLNDAYPYLMTSLNEKVAVKVKK